MSRLNLRSAFFDVLARRQRGEPCPEEHPWNDTDRDVILPGIVSGLRAMYRAHRAGNYKEAYKAAEGQRARLEYLPFMWALPATIRCNGLPVQTVELMDIADRAMGRWLEAVRWGSAGALPLK